MAINHYRLEPGERGAGLHAHGDQEEVFLVLEGEATIETMDGRVGVGAGEAIRFAPGEHHSGLIAGGSELVGLALGAPRDSEDVRIPLPCPECGSDAMRATLGGDGGSVVGVCGDCGAETSR